MLYRLFRLIYRNQDFWVCHIRGGIDTKIKEGDLGGYPLVGMWWEMLVWALMENMVKYGKFGSLLRYKLERLYFF